MTTEEGFGRRLLRLRRSRGLTQTQLGAAIGTSAQLIYLLETGRQTGTTRGTIARLAEALGVTPSYLEYGVADVEAEPPIEVYLRQTRPGLSEHDVQMVARIVRSLEAEQLAENEHVEGTNGQHGGPGGP